MPRVLAFHANNSAWEPTALLALDRFPSWWQSCANNSLLHSPSFSLCNTHNKYCSNNNGSNMQVIEVHITKKYKSMSAIAAVTPHMHQKAKQKNSHEFTLISGVMCIQPSITKKPSKRHINKHNRCLYCLPFCFYFAIRGIGSIIFNLSVLQLQSIPSQLQIFRHIASTRAF